jgi:hypothetical protein
MPVLETKGALSAQGFGLTTPVNKNYIEDVFSTWLYTGNGGEQPIINNINLNNGADSSFTTNVGTLPVSISVQYGGIAFGAGRYVAISGNFPTATAAYSTDGVNWTLTTLPTSQVWRDVSFCPGQGFVAIGTPSAGPGTAFARSTDGITWTAITLGQNGNWRSITNNGSSTFVAVSGNGINRIAYSTNGGVSWSFVASPNSGGLVSVAYGNNRFVGVNILSTTAAYSLDGITWTASTLPNQVSTVAHVAGRFIAVNGNGSNNTGATSVDGISWQALTLPVSAFWNCVSGISGNICVSSSNTTLVSNDLINWENKSFGAERTVKNSTQLLFANSVDSLDSLSFPNTANGLVWLKSRSAATDHALYDTARGATFDIASNTTAAQTTQSTGLTGFLANGFSIGSLAKVNTNAATYASWTFREQPKFFDIVTYTGNGANRTIAHNLGSVPGCIMVKRLNATADWQVYHRSLANTQYLVLNSDAAAATGATRWNSTTPTDTVFSLGTDASVNASGGTYVAYLFAHNAGGFGATGTDNVISCGSFTTDGSGNATVNLGYEPQWVLIKESVAVGSYGWIMLDNMRDWSMEFLDKVLYANLANAESTFNGGNPTSTGFVSPVLLSSSTYIYIAIRRGPMRTPTTGTSVFAPVQSTSVATSLTVITNFAVDLTIARVASIVNETLVVDKLRGGTTTTINFLRSNGTNAEAASSGAGIGFQYNDSVVDNGVITGSSNKKIYWNFRRAPGFFDVVCYTGTGANRTVNHNLGVVPELMIVKGRSGATAWQAYSNALANTEYLVLNTTAAKATGATRWNSTTPTSSVFSLGTASEVNTNAATYVAYLFATCPGVSKVGSYTGTGATQVVDCGFAAGARFVLIKRTDSTGDWYVWDSARGIVAGNDPYLLLNSTAAEVTNTDWVDTAASGFELSNAGGNNVNINGASYIFLSVA